MKSCKCKTAVTLIEMLIVVGIIATLAAMVITIAGRIEARAKEQLAESTITLITAAVEQFRDYDYEYPHADYSALKFPLDCNNIVHSYIEAALDATAAGYIDDEVWCYFLSRVPECRKTLDKIAPSLKQGASITVGGIERDFMRIIDPWGNKIRYRYDYDYDYYLGLNPLNRTWTFPLITSAGPDGIHGNDDDITSK